jgi:hypothetical protein
VPRRGQPAAPVGGADRRHLGPGVADRVDHHDRDAPGLELGVLGRAEVGEDRDDAGRPAGQHLLDPGPARHPPALQLREDHAQPAVPRHLLNAADDLDRPGALQLVEHQLQQLGRGGATGNAPGCGSGCTSCCLTNSAATVASTGRGPAWTRSACAQAGGPLTGPNPTDRGKPGSKYHLLVERGGIPLAVGLSAANTHDSMLLEQLVDAVPAIKGPRGRPGRPRKRPSKLRCDKGFDYSHCRRARVDAGSRPGSPDAGSSRASGSAGTGMWWSGRWRGWWATGGCRFATSDVPTSCWRSSTSRVR